MNIASLIAGIAVASSQGYEAAPDSVNTNLYNLEEVVVTATRAPRLLKNTPVQTRLISEKEIERTDATDIRDLLQEELPGVEFSYAMNQQVHLNFNGQGGQSVLFLVDGERLAGETMDDVDFSRLNMSDVERIEIVKGASSALYGSNAGGGVINIISKKASKKWRVEADARTARHNSQRYNLSASANAGKFSNVFTGNYSCIDNYKVHSAPDPIARVVSEIYGGRVWNFSDKLTFRLSESLRLTGRAGYYFRQVKRVEDSPERYRDYSAGLRGEWEITGCDFLDVSYAFDQYDKSDFHKLSDTDVRSYSNVQNSLRALYNHTFGSDNILTAGADVMRDYLRNTKLADPVRSQVSADAFLQYDHTFSDKWEVVGALRYDYFSDGNLSRVTPKVSARFRPRYDITLRAGYGMGFRAPTLKEKYYDFDMAGIWIVNGNPSLKPESSNNLTLSAEYSHGNYNVTLSGYFNDIRNRISTGVPYYRPGDDRQLYLDYVNLRHYSVAGAELSLRGRWGNGLSAGITYAFTDEHLARDKEGNSTATQYIPARKHSLTARCDWEKDLGRDFVFTASLSGRALSGVSNVEYKDYYNVAAGTTKVDYPPYTLWKIAVTQSIGKHVRISLALDNIFNYKPKHYYLNSPLTDGINLMAGASVDLF